MQLSFFLLVFLLSTFAEANPISRSWYLMRAHSNMQIKNYAAAIEAWEKLVAMDPNDQEAQKELGLAYEKQGETDKAISQFDRYLAKFPDDSEIAFKQSGYLEWSRYAYRRKDAIKYLRAGLRHDNDKQMRHRLARLLAKDKSNLDEAVKEYETLLADEPKNKIYRQEYQKLLMWDPRFVKKAIHEHEELLRAHPDDLSLRIEYAKLLAQDRSRTDDAIDEYEKILRKRKDLSLQIAYADLLSRRSSSRADAIAQYRQIVSKSPEARHRLKLARLLGSEKSSAPEAIEQYQKVLKQQPKNAEAHFEIARAYAWTGDDERAVYHTRLAKKHGGDRGDVASFRETLGEGREDQLGGEFAFGNSDRSGELTDYALSMKVKKEVGAFVTLEGRGGPEIFYGDRRTLASFYGAGVLRYRFTETLRADGEMAYHSMGGENPAFLFRGEVGMADVKTKLQGGFKRVLKNDSITSLSLARDQVFYGDFEQGWELGRVFGGPRVGWVSTDQSNGHYELEGRGEIYLFNPTQGFVADLSHSVRVMHFDSDFSSKDRGGYFSPSFFAANTPKVGVGWRFNEGNSLRLEGGPSLQYVASAFQLGTDVGLNWKWRVAQAIRAEMQASYFDIPKSYRRAQLTATVIYQF